MKLKLILFAPLFLPVHDKDLAALPIGKKAERAITLTLTTLIVLLTVDKTGSALLSIEPFFKVIGRWLYLLSFFALSAAFWSFLNSESASKMNGEVSRLSRPSRKLVGAIHYGVAAACLGLLSMI